MSHRDKSISSHITNAAYPDPVTDEEKHAWCKKRTGLGAIFLTPSMYAAVEREGMDMRRFVIQKPMPEEPMGRTPRKRCDHPACDCRSPCSNPPRRDET